MTSHRRDMSTLLLVALLATSAWTTRAANWPLNGYAPCAEQPTKILAGPWGDSLKLDTADFAFNDDADALWVGAEGVLYKFRYSDGALLSSLDLATVGGFLEGRLSLLDIHRCPMRLKRFPFC